MQEIKAKIPLFQGIIIELINNLLVYPRCKELENISEHKQYNESNN